jgi:Thioredoxin
MVTLVEYADFDCHYCAGAYRVVQDLWARFAPCLRVVFRHSPRSYGHPRAALAAEAAEAAAEQGKFWEMHDCLFQHQGALEAVDLLNYAQWLGLDDEKFAGALCTQSHRARVRRDQLTGIRSRVISTPAFFVNGRRFSDTPDRETLGDAIERARNCVTLALSERQCATSGTALTRLAALATSLRDAYKRQYWHGLTLPFVGLRMLLGAHTREQTELIECIARRLKLVGSALPQGHGADVQLKELETPLIGTESVKFSIAYLLEAHHSMLSRAHAIANSLADFGDTESRDLVKQRVVATNERQATSLTGQLLADRRGV